MKFSIVIPSYNQGEFLERTLLSVINQGVETEIIVIDGGSADNSVEIIKKYEDKIAYWVSEKDRGQSHALNKGFAQATGEIFGWQNSDDIYMPGAFKKVLEVFEKFPEKKIVYGNWYEIDEFDNVIDKTYSAPKPRVPHFSYEGFDSNLQSMFWKREIFEKFGAFDENLHQLMDSDFLFSLILNQGCDIFLKTDFFFGGFRRHENQKTKRERIDKRAVDEQKVLEQKYGFANFGFFAKKFYKTRYAVAKFSWLAKQGGMILAFRHLSRALFKRAGYL
ncbi:glycosyltransferase [bacterium]|nr:glycosyltransferase [bacterium]